MKNVDIVRSVLALVMILVLGAILHALFGWEGLTFGEALTLACFTTLVQAVREGQHG